jgi:hypothetical protein
LRLDGLLAVPDAPVRFFAHQPVSAPTAGDQRAVETGAGPVETDRAIAVLDQASLLLDHGHGAHQPFDHGRAEPILRGGRQRAAKRRATLSDLGRPLVDRSEPTVLAA